MDVPRRKVLSGTTAAVAVAIAGCIGGSDGEEPDDVDLEDDGDVDPDDISVPTVVFSLSHEESENQVQVRHSGGRGVSVDNLFIRGEGIDEEYDETAFIELPESEFSAGDMFGSGDSVTVEVVEDEFRVEVLWVDLESEVPVVVDQIAVGLEEA